MGQPRRPRPRPSAACSCSALFAWYESRIEHPSARRRLFKNRSLSASVGSIALLFFGMGGVYFFTSFYFQNVRGYSPLDTGLLAVPFALGQFLMSPRSASLVHRYGIRAVMVTGMLAERGRHRRLGVPRRRPRRSGSSRCCSSSRAPGSAWRSPTATASVMEALPRERAGAGSALTNTARQVAVALSVAVLGSILSSAYRPRSTPRWSRCPPGRGTPPARRSPPPRRSRPNSATPASSCSPRRTPPSWTRCGSPPAIAAALAVVGAIALLRWMPGRKRPTIEELVAAEVAAAERELEAGNLPERSELSER